MQPSKTDMVPSVMQKQDFLIFFYFSVELSLFYSVIKNTTSDFQLFSEDGTIHICSFSNPSNYHAAINIHFIEKGFKKLHILYHPWLYLSKVMRNV